MFFFLHFFVYIYNVITIEIIIFNCDQNYICVGCVFPPFLFIFSFFFFLSLFFFFFFFPFFFFFKKKFIFLFIFFFFYRPHPSGPLKFRSFFPSPATIFIPFFFLRSSRRIFRFCCRDTPCFNGCLRKRSGVSSVEVCKVCSSLSLCPWSQSLCCCVP